MFFRDGWVLEDIFLKEFVLSNFTLQKPSWTLMSPFETCRVYITDGWFWPTCNIFSCIFSCASLVFWGISVVFLLYFSCVSLIFLLYFFCIYSVFLLYFFCNSFVFLLYFFCISFVFLLYFSGQTGWGEWNANAIGPTLDNVKPPPTEPSTIQGGEESAETKLNKWNQEYGRVLEGYKDYF